MNQPPIPTISKVEPLVIRYFGSLAENMTLYSVLDVADAIEQLSKRYPIQFEIYTRPPWLMPIRDKLRKFNSVTVREQVRDIAEYRRLLMESDILLIAYNFDQTSINYIRYSLANKLPEFLASGATVFAYGPSDVATMAQLRDALVAQVVTEQGTAALEAGLEPLLTNPARRRQIGAAGRRYAFHRHNGQLVTRRFWDILFSARGCDGLPDAGGKSRTAETFEGLGPFPRDLEFHLDETRCIGRILDHCEGGSLMVDVGAHHGSALTPFLDMGWQIIAFEPDAKNRKVLEERLAQHPQRDRIRLEADAVSDERRTNVAFYQSEESSGISSLHAFHESHEAADCVNTTTVRLALRAEEAKKVAFLKIDAEGHDLFVLKGFPWEIGRPEVIECEFEDNKTVPLGYTVHDLAEFLLDRGYRVYISEWHPVVRYGIRHDWCRLERYPIEMLTPDSWGNLVAVLPHIPPEKITQAFRAEIRAAGSSALFPSGATVEEKQRQELENDRFVREVRPRLGKARRAETLCVLGNGPSLKDIDLANLRGVDTVGLNAAYRHWDRIGWYPTYYCCLDTAVVESHHAAIRRLVEEQGQNGIRLFFLQKNILKRQPQLADRPAVLIYDDWRKSTVFNDSSHVTTGAFAALLGMALGYRRLHLLGVDCRYVEQIAEAQPLESNVREIVTDPEHNPNYFFDDYQRKGDRFHVPNSVPALHLASWVDCAKTAARFGVTITNGSPNSALRLFPLANIEDVSGSSQLVHGRSSEEPASDVIPPTRRKASMNSSSSSQANRPTKETPSPEITLRIGKEALGEGWSDPVEQTGAPFRWLRAGAKVEVRVNVLRRAPLLLVLTSPKSLKSLEAKRLRLEADGAPLDVQVRWGTSPNVISSVLPAAPDKPYGENTRLVLRLDPPREGQIEQSGPNSVAIDRIYMIRPVGGRTTDFPLSYFDGKAYLDRFPDVALAVSEGMQSSALAHYKRFGGKEGRPLLLALGEQPSAGTAFELALTDVSSRFRTELAAARKASDDKLDQHSKALEGNILDRTKALTDRLESLDSQIREMNQWKGGFETRLHENLNKRLSELEDAISARLTNVEQELSRTVTDLTTRSETDREQRRKLEETLSSRLSTVQKELSGTVTDLATRSETDREQLRSHIATELDGLRRTFGNKLEATRESLSASYQRFPRILTDTDAKHIEKKWGSALGIELKGSRRLHYLAERIRQAERMGHGRLAASVQAVLVRILVAQSVQHRRLRLLEIGTLFGIGLVSIHEALRGYFDSIHLSAIDPLDGYYGPSQRDILTGAPVNADLVRENFRRAGIDTKRYTLIQARSDDPKAVTRARRRRYDVLIIDGDHSYDGVRSDFELYSPMVVSGGYIIFDDCGNPHWPEVGRCVDEIVRPTEYMELIGEDWSTAVFRVVRENEASSKATPPRSSAHRATKRRKRNVRKVLGKNGRSPRPSRRRPT